MPDCKATKPGESYEKLLLLPLKILHFKQAWRMKKNLLNDYILIAEGTEEENRALCLFLIRAHSSGGIGASTNATATVS